MSFILDVQEDENGDLFIVLPDEMVDTLGWQEGDVLDWDLKGGGIILSRVSDPAGYEVIED